MWKEECPFRLLYSVFFCIFQFRMFYFVCSSAPWSLDGSCIDYVAGGSESRDLAQSCRAASRSKFWRRYHEKRRSPAAQGGRILRKCEPFLGTSMLTFSRWCRTCPALWPADSPFGRLLAEEHKTVSVTGQHHTCPLHAGRSLVEKLGFHCLLPSGRDISVISVSASWTDTTMSCLCAAPAELAEQQRKSKKIDVLLREEKLKRKRQLKILVLGSGESGKSTFIKQMRIIHGEDFAERDRQSFLPIIFENILTAAKTLVKEREKLQIPWGNSVSESHARLISSADNTEEDVKLYVEALTHLWSDSGIRETYRRRSQFLLVSQTWIPWSNYLIFCCRR